MHLDIPIVLEMLCSSIQLLNQISFTWLYSADNSAPKFSHKLLFNHKKVLILAKLIDNINGKLVSKFKTIQNISYYFT